MKAKYLGEEDVTKKVTKYTTYSREQWALLWIEVYGGIGGEHHKNWLLDQIARILKGTGVIVKIASWEGEETEERFNLEEPPQKYWDWVADMKAGDDGPDSYEYDFGIAP